MESINDKGYPTRRQLGCWSSLLIILMAVGLQRVAAWNGVKLCWALHASAAVAAVPRPKESVRAELVQLQKQTGLTLASDQDGIEIALFDKRTLIHGRKFFDLWSWGVISRDGTEIAARYRRENRFILGVVWLDGSNLREYPEVRPQNICWSNDKSKLAVTVHRGSPDAALEVMPLEGNVTEEIEPKAQLTAQCWSPDDKKIVYQVDDSIRVYEFGEGKAPALVLAKGEFPSWSPDGNWIAFLDHDTYYAIHPNGQERKKLFHYGDAFSALYWSPDSRIVAYETALGFLQGGALDAEVYELRVRRLEDGSDDWVVKGLIPGGNFQWVTNPDLLKLVKSQAAH